MKTFILYFGTFFFFSGSIWGHSLTSDQVQEVIHSRNKACEGLGYFSWNPTQINVSPTFNFVQMNEMKKACTDLGSTNTACRSFFETSSEQWPDPCLKDLKPKSIEAGCQELRLLSAAQYNKTITNGSESKALCHYSLLCRGRVAVPTLNNNTIRTRVVGQKGKTYPFLLACKSENGVCSKDLQRICKQVPEFQEPSEFSIIPSDNPPAIEPGTPSRP